MVKDDRGGRDAAASLIFLSPGPNSRLVLKTKVKIRRK